MGFRKRKQVKGSRPIRIGMKKRRPPRRIVVDAGPGNRHVSGGIPHRSNDMPGRHPAGRDPGRAETNGVTGPSEGQVDGGKSFWMDKYPVTNAQFKKFVDATHYHPHSFGGRQADSLSVAHLRVCQWRR